MRSGISTKNPRNQSLQSCRTTDTGKMTSHSAILVNRSLLSQNKNKFCVEIAVPLWLQMILSEDSRSCRYSVNTAYSRTPSRCLLRREKPHISIHYMTSNSNSHNLHTQNSHVQACTPLQLEHPQSIEPHLNPPTRHPPRATRLWQRRRSSEEVTSIREKRKYRPLEALSGHRSSPESSSRDEQADLNFCPQAINQVTNLASPGREIEQPIKRELIGAKVESQSHLPTVVLWKGVSNPKAESRIGANWQ